MKKLTRFGILIFCFFTFLQITYSQNQKEHYDAIYSLNNKLYNGYIYNGNYGSKVKGNTFLYENFSLGSLVLEGTDFKDLLLNYDIYNQLLILNFNAQTTTNMKIEVPFFKLSAFTIGDDIFKIIQQPDSTYQVYQIIGDDHASFWLKHQKKLELETMNQQYDYTFSRDFIQVYFSKNTDFLFELKNNKSLVKLFEKTQRNQLKKWLRKNRIKIKKANPHQLELLSQYLNQL